MEPVAPMAWTEEATTWGAFLKCASACTCVNVCASENDPATLQLSVLDASFHVNLAEEPVARAPPPPPHHTANIIFTRPN